MEENLATQIETVYADITSAQYGQALIDAAPVLVSIGGFVKGLGFAGTPMAQEEFMKGSDTLQKCVDECQKAQKKAKAAPVGKIGDGAILKALENLLQFALQVWPLIAPFIPLSPTPPSP